jgi:hypothetical protein
MMTTLVGWLVRAAAVLTLAAVLSGCSTPSINPLYSDDGREVVADDRIVGEWVQAVNEGKDKPRPDRYTVTRVPVHDGDGRAAQYKMVRHRGGTDPAHTGPDSFEVHLVRLGGNHFIDAIPDQSALEGLGARFGLAVLPMHIIMPIRIEQDRLVVRPLDPNKVYQLLTDSPKTTPHAIRDKLVILTGTSREVQEFFRKFVAGDELFTEPVELTRVVKPEAGEPSPPR